MKNKAIDLHNILFEQIERLNDLNYKGDDLAEEIRRAEAMNRTAGAIMANSRLVLEAQRMIDENLIQDIPEMLLSNAVPKKVAVKKRLLLE